MGFITDILKDIPVNAVLRDKIQVLEKRYEELEAENTQLKGENQKLQNKVKELTNSDELCEIEVNILKLLSNSGQELTAAMIARGLCLNLTKIEYHLERMWNQYVYSHDYCTERPSEYYLIQKGREYLIKNDYI